MKRIIAIIIVLGLMLGIGFKVFQKISHKTENQPSLGRGFGRGNGGGAAVVKVAPAKRQVLRETLNLVGEVATEDETIIQPKVSGRLLQLIVDEGQAVHRNQLLAVLDDEAIGLQLQQSETNISNITANLRQAELNLAKAKTEKERYEELLNQKYISQKDYDNVENTYLNAQTSVEVLKGQLLSARKSYDLLKIQMNETRIYSPVDGYVIQKNVSPGMNLTTGTNLMTLAPLSRVKIKFNVDQKDAAKIRKGTSVEFSTDAFPNDVFRGVIEQTAPVYDSNTRTLAFTVTLSNKDLRLVPGMFGSIAVVVGINEQALVVPQEAVVSQGGQFGVFCIVQEQDKMAKFTQVTTGISSEGMVEIISGLNEGDSVVIVGQNTLRDGQMVQILGSQDGRDGQRQRSGNNRPNNGPSQNWQKGQQSDGQPNQQPRRRPSQMNFKNGGANQNESGQQGDWKSRRRENQGQ